MDSCEVLAGCCIAIGGIFAWCNIGPYGLRCCGNCCGCQKQEEDENELDRQAVEWQQEDAQRAMEAAENRKSEAPRVSGGPVRNQPGGTDAMDVSGSPNTRPRLVPEWE